MLAYFKVSCELAANAPMQLMIQEPDKEPRPIQYHEATRIIIQQGDQLKTNQTRIEELEKQCSQLSGKNAELEKRVSEISDKAKKMLQEEPDKIVTTNKNTSMNHVYKLKSKSQPEIMVKI